MATIRASLSNIAANVGSGTVTGAQNGLNATRTPNVVEMGGNLLIDTVVDGVGGGKTNSMTWDNIATYAIQNLTNQLFFSLVRTGFINNDKEMTWFMSHQQSIRRYWDYDEDKRIQENINNIGANGGWSWTVTRESDSLNYSNIQITPDNIIIHNDGNLSGIPNVRLLNLPIFPSVAAAIADVNLVGDSLFRVSGDNIVYQKD